jgi:hypothetical protein
MAALLAASPLGFVARWSTRSQEQARRNAMAACTVLTARRTERAEVDEFVAGYLARRVQTATATENTPIRSVS